jgi:hypothetical protein
MESKSTPATTTTFKFGWTQLLTVLFIALKLTKVIDWSWVWILSPLWIAFLLWLIFIVVFIVFLSIVKNN